jgi:hypothetical protein
MTSIFASLPMAVAVAVAVAALAAGIGAFCALGLVLQIRRDLRLLGESFECLLAAQRSEWTGEIEKIRLEAEQTLVTHPERKQAMQMFRAGIAPDTVAAKLGVPKREMRLAAEIFRIITGGF